MTEEQRAELAAAIDRILPITVQETPDYAELSFGECQTQAMTMEPDTWLALNALPDLLATIARLEAEKVKDGEALERVMSVCTVFSGRDARAHAQEIARARLSSRAKDQSQ